MLDDNLYLLSVCDELRAQAQAQQAEPVHKGVRGVIATRWESTITALSEHKTASPSSFAGYERSSSGRRLMRAGCRLALRF